MDSLMRYKGALAGVFLLVGLYFVYVNFIQGTGNDPILTSTQVAGVGGTAAGQEIIGILEELKDISLDTSLFENEFFNALVDRREAIEGESVGRSNPFDPIGFGINPKGVIAEPSEEKIQVIDIRTPEVNTESDNQ